MAKVTARKEYTIMATKEIRLKTAEIFMALDTDAQQQVIKAAAERGRDAAYRVAVALLHNQPVPPAATVKEAPKQHPADVLGDMLSVAAQAAGATVLRSKNLIEEHQGVNPGKWWK